MKFSQLFTEFYLFFLSLEKTFRQLNNVVKLYTECAVLLLLIASLSFLSKIKYFTLRSIDYLYIVGNIKINIIILAKLILSMHFALISSLLLTD